MTDNELDMLMQSLSDEEIGSLYASLPESADTAAADRIANRFYAKCAAAGTPIVKAKRRPRIKIKYLGFSAAACVAVAASAAAYYSSQTEKPGVIPETTAAVTAYTETTYTETVTAAQTALQTSGSAAQTKYTTQSVTQSSVPVTTQSVTQSSVSVTTQSVTQSSVPVTTQSVTESSASRTVTSRTTVTKRTTGTTSYTTGATSTTTTYATATTMTQSPQYTWAPTTTRRIETTTIYEPPVETCLTSACYTDEPRPQTSAAQPNKGAVSADHAAVWLVHAPFCNTYHVGEDFDLTGTRLGVWYLSRDNGVMENERSVLLSEHPEMFTVDASAYRADRPGTYAIRVIYDRGKIIGSSAPAAAKSVNIYVTVIE